MDGTTTRRSVDLPAGTIDYREAGPADGRPVVFVHGVLIDDALWADVPQRLAEAGLRTFAPTWPTGAHRTAVDPAADLSPRGLAEVVASFLAAHDLRDVVLVGSDTGGAICQLLIDEDASRIGQLVLTNCDAFEVFPPSPFGLLFRLARHPGAARVVLAPVRRDGVRRRIFAGLTRRPLDAAETLPWVLPYLTDARVRADFARFARGWRPTALVDVGTRLGAFDRPVLLCWGTAADPLFPPALGRRLQRAFPDARFVEVDDAGTLVSLDQPERLAKEIIAFTGAAAAGAAAAGDD